MNDHEKWMREAIRLSRENVRNNLGGPFGAVIVRDNQLVATGTNLVTTTNDPTAHAEVVAVRATCAVLQTFELRDCVLYTSCEPCPMCLGAIYWARLEAVYYGNTRADAADAGFDDLHIYEELALPILQRNLPMHGLLRDEALNAFADWQVAEERVVY